MMGYRKNHGFTLVELLTVVAILALLAVLAAPRIQSAGAAARQARAERDLKTIQEALEHHYVDLGYYPRKLKDLVTHGYIKPATGSDPFEQFRSPTSKSYYFYAVDNNRDNVKAQAYVLGNPSPNAPDYDELGSGANRLYPIGMIPQGRPPEIRAWAWAGWQGLSELRLYRRKPHNPSEFELILLANVPDNLGDYRDSCRSDAPEPSPNDLCDLIAN